ncbi:fungal-specific transcription factor domain-containing protein [Myxozyma melibiosi]|uniref:Fungal-specific transcription factor domain-containing protein n=1 Tax=Myxozyma melibiosi TaxID=54550 RepID=A0ABR1FBM8_9ASCO
MAQSSYSPSSSSSADTSTHARAPSARSGASSRSQGQGQNISSQSASPQTASRGPRISHACEPCRIRKTKCSGDKPVCSHCQSFGIGCYYANNKRDRTKEELQNLRGKVTKYESILKKLQRTLPRSSREDIDDVLRPQTGHSLDPAQPSESSFPKQSRFDLSRKAPPGSVDTKATAEIEDTSDSELAGEDLVSAEVGSTGSIDHLNEDINSIGMSDPEGYIGKSSSVDWIKKIYDVVYEDESNSDDDNLSKSGFFDSTLADFNASYNLDDLDIAVDAVDLSSMPPRHAADQLVEYYFKTVHPSFPFILEPLFRYQYDLFWAGYLDDQNGQWLALLNIIFAISSTVAHIGRADVGYIELDHLQFYGRAKILKPDVTVPGDVQHIQYIALLSFYLFATNHLNRCYCLLGLAVRQGQSVGLHLRINRAKLTDAQKEVRVRLWNALYVFERTVCGLTGRPSIITDFSTSAPLPSTSAESENFDFIPQLSSQATSMTKKLQARYFLNEVEISRILGQVMDKLYAPEIVNYTWSSVLHVIKDLNNMIDEWKENLPAILHLDLSSPIDYSSEDLMLLKMRVHLQLLYYDVIRLINRPCLCRTDIPGESRESREFTTQCAYRAMEAGHKTMLLFPDFRRLKLTPYVYEAVVCVLPWWCSVSYAMGSISAMVLGHKMGYSPKGIDADVIVDDLDRLSCVIAAYGNYMASTRCLEILTNLRQRAMKRSPSIYHVQRAPPPEFSSNDSPATLAAQFGSSTLSAQEGANPALTVSPEQYYSSGGQNTPSNSMGNPNIYSPYNPAADDGSSISGTDLRSLQSPANTDDIMMAGSDFRSQPMNSQPMEQQQFYHQGLAPATQVTQVSGHTMALTQQQMMQMQPGTHNQITSYPQQEVPYMSQLGGPDKQSMQAMTSDILSSVPQQASASVITDTMMQQGVQDEENTFPPSSGF